MLANGSAALSSRTNQTSTAGDEPSGGIISVPSGSNNVTAAVQEHRRLFNRQLVRTLFPTYERIGCKC